MKRTYAAARLLEHGPLTMGELLEVTRWPRSTVDWVLRELMAIGLVVAEPISECRNEYRLCAPK